MTPFERGLVAHLVADWVLQTDWMARSKARRNLTAACHAGAYALPFLLLLRMDAKLKLALMVPLCLWAWAMHFVDMSFNILPPLQSIFATWTESVLPALQRGLNLTHWFEYERGQGLSPAELRALRVAHPDAEACRDRPGHPDHCRSRAHRAARIG